MRKRHAPTPFYTTLNPDGTFPLVTHDGEAATLSGCHIHHPTSGELLGVWSFEASVDGQHYAAIRPMWDGAVFAVEGDDIP